MHVYCIPKPSSSSLEERQSWGLMSALHLKYTHSPPITTNYYVSTFIQTSSSQESRNPGHVINPTNKQTKRERTREKAKRTS
jgi:hypothetical protein